MRSVLAAGLLIFGANLVSAAEPLTAETPTADPVPLKLLIEQLTSADSRLRGAAVNNLRERTGPLDDWNDLLDQETAAARRRLRDEARPLLPQIISFVNGPDGESRKAAVELLGTLGSAATPAIPALQKLVLTTGPDLEEDGWSGLWAMLQILPEDQPIGPFLLRYVETFSPEVQEAMRSLWTEATQSLQGPVTSEFVSGSIAIGMYAGTIAVPMIHMGHTTIELPFLVQATSPKYPPFVRGIAIGILGTFEREAAPAIPALRLLLDDPEPAVRYLAASALMRIEQRPDAIEELSATLRLSDEQEAVFATRAKKHLADKREERAQRRNWQPDWDVAIAAALLKDHRGTQRRYALRMLQDAGLQAYAAVPAIVELLQDPNAETRAAAIEALWAIDPETATWELRTR